MVKLYLQLTTNMNIIATGTRTKNNKIFHSLLDCEYIQKDKNDDVIDLYAGFDIYYINKKEHRDLPFMNSEDVNKSRHGLMEKFIRILKPESVMPGQPSPIRIEPKQFYFSGNIFKDNKNILDKINDNLFEYETDGLVFTPSDLTLPRDYVKKTWDKSFKWKPPQFNTIDFLVKMKDDVKTEYIEDNIMNYKTLTLMCGFQENESGYLHPCADVLDDLKVEDIIGNVKRGAKPDFNAGYKPQKFFPTKPYDNQAHLCNVNVVNNMGVDVVKTEDNEVIEDNMIVECYYDFSRPKLWKWVPLRVRYDKTRELRNGKKIMEIVIRLLIVIGNPFIIH